VEYSTGARLEINDIIGFNSGLDGTKYPSNSDKIFHALDVDPLGTKREREFE
jgi:hypothetical protein